MSLTILEGSIRTLAPAHSGAAIFYLGDMKFSTDIVGDSQESSFRVSAPAMSLLFLDDLAADDARTEPPKASTISEGISHWKARPRLVPRLSKLMDIYRQLDMPYLLRSLIWT